MLLRNLILTTTLLGAAGQVLATPANAPTDLDDCATTLGHSLAQLDTNPDDITARKEAWRCAMRLGLAEQAASLQAPLSEAELASMEGDRIALAIRYGRIDARILTGPERYAALDRAIAATDSLAERFFNGRPINAEQQRRLTDRISALVARQRPAQALALYQRLADLHIALPDWALRDVADAWLMQRQPAHAAILYRQVLASSPDDFDANLGLFYALVESEHLDLAQAQIDSFAERLPPRRHLDGQANGERTSAVLTGDLLRVYANRIQEARQRIAARLAEMPYNQEARGVAISTELALGWQRLAEMGLRSSINNDPNNANLRADHSGLLLALQHWDQAEAELKTAQQLDPDQARVELAAEAVAQWRSPELNVDAGYGQGQNQDPFGSSDYHVDTTLYSAPLGDVWRLFLHSYAANADFYGTSVDWTRTGAGVEWRSGDWQASAEANTGEFAKTGALGAVQWHVDDFWKLYGNFASVSNDIQLQAVAADVTARQTTLGVDWQPFDGRTFAVATSYSDFSDSNHRSALLASWFERWCSGPRWTLDSTLGADTSHNSLGYAADYFNPPDDHSIWLSGAIDNLTWRNYDWSWHQRLSVSLGRYWQSGFDGTASEAIEYQHRWELGRSATLNYSIGRSLRPYDGVREARNYGTMTLLWHF